MFPQADVMAWLVGIRLRCEDGPTAWEDTSQYGLHTKVKHE